MQKYFSNFSQIMEFQQEFFCDYLLYIQRKEGEKGEIN